MNVILLSPPGLSPFSPPLSLITLESFLRKNDINVLAIDASIDALHYNLSPHNIKLNLKKSQILLDKFTTHNNNLINYLNNIKVNITEIEEIVYRVWNEEGFAISKNNFKMQINALNDALLFSSLVNYPTICSLNDIRVDLSVITNPRSNPFYEYMTNILIPRILEFQPDLIGFSCNYLTQIAFCLSLIHEIKNKSNISMVVGGSAFTSLLIEMKEQKTSFVNKNVNQEVRQLLQPFGIVGEGEIPLLNLCKAIINNDPHYNDISGLVYCNNDLIYVNENKTQASTDNIPILDLKSFPVSKKYLTPISIAPIYSSRGCYWNKCTFCSHASIIGSSWRELPIETIIHNIKAFNKNHNIELFEFCDEAMSPSMLKRLSKKIIDEGIDITFGTMARFEKGIIDAIEIASKAGCKYLSFGLESGCPRIVSLMKKGYDHELAQCVLDKCKANGIFVELFIMFGFPTETISDAQETISFIENNSDVIFCLRANVWHLAIGSDIYNNPDKYKIDIHNPYNNLVDNGVSREVALHFIEKIKSSPILGPKLIQNGFRGFTEEYYAIGLFD